MVNEALIAQAATLRKAGKRRPAKTTLNKALRQAGVGERRDVRDLYRELLVNGPHPQAALALA